jgi:mannose-6-phosphate isomerase-like protein (cupin superfamily)
MTDAESPQRPWGFVEILAEEQDHKVTRLTIIPGGRLSLQRHQRRLEHWYVIKGSAIATLGYKKVKLSAGSSVDVPVRTVHRIENTETDPFVLIEIQRGEYFGEDDIERFEDDYGRI